MVDKSTHTSVGTESAPQQFFYVHFQRQGLLKNILARVKI